MKSRHTLSALAAAVLAVTGLAAPAHADVNVGVTLSATGPAASLGIPEKNTFEILPTTIAGEKINWIILDDASDTTKAVTNTRKLITEDKVDIVIGSTITPNSLAMVDIVSEAEVPMISMAASARIVDPANPKTRWVFKTPQSDALMADAIAINMKANGVKTMGYIGFNDAYGEGWLNEIKHSAKTAGIKVVAEEKYNRNDTSVTGQVLKLVSANPDAILIGAAGTPGATPQKELVARGYKGKIYQTHGVANPRLPARRRQGWQWHDPPDRADAGVRAASRLESAQEVGRGIHHEVRGEIRQGLALDFRRSRMGCLRAVLQRAADRAQEGKARHQGIPSRIARRARGREGNHRLARRIHNDAAGPQRARQSRPDDDQDRQRQVGPREVGPE